MDVTKAVRTSLDTVKKKSPNGIEYWMARDLQVPLGYAKWDNFEGVVKKAQMACESTGVDPSNHILVTGKMVGVGSGAERERRDYYVSRYGAYLIAMNGSPRLPPIAEAQDYFAVQTRRQELADQAQDISKRLELRDRVKKANKHLGDAAKDAGVQSWALFHDAGYRGLYGLALKEIKERKGLDRKDDLLDRAGRTELAANEFRITQTEQALKRDHIQGDPQARETHRKVGEAVRKTIQELNGTMPEDLPAEPSLKKLTAARRNQKLLQAREEEDRDKK
jgi:DNA-damage-inducible protein D